MHHPTDRIAHTTAFFTIVVEHWLEREIVGPIEQFFPPASAPRLLYSKVVVCAILSVG